MTLPERVEARIETYQRLDATAPWLAPARSDQPVGPVCDGTERTGQHGGANPIAIIVSCHRVVGAGGALTSYAGGPARKRWLLAHEVQRSSSAIATAGVS